MALAGPYAVQNPPGVEVGGARCCEAAAGSGANRGGRPIALTDPCAAEAEGGAMREEAPTDGPGSSIRSRVRDCTRMRWAADTTGSPRLFRRGAHTRFRALVSCRTHGSDVATHQQRPRVRGKSRLAATRFRSVTPGQTHPIGQLLFAETCLAHQLHLGGSGGIRLQCTGHESTCDAPIFSDS
jgi:hypothetical protein